MDPFSTAENLQRQIDIILILLERPVVRLQLGVLIAVLVVSWLLVFLFGRLNSFPQISSIPTSFRKTVKTVAETTAFPVISLIILQLVIFYFSFRQLPHGFLQDFQPLLLIALVYELLLSFLYLRFSREIVHLFHKRILRPFLILLILYLWVNNFLNLELIGQIVLFELFGLTVTVGVIARILLIVYLFGTASYLLQDALKRRMTQYTPETASVTSLLIVSRYAVIGLGLVALAAALGVNAATLAVIGGGLSIGIGFGLQQIVANFISGILLLFEKSLRPGDVIELNGQLGIVKQVNIRSTTIETNDNIQIIVPNEQFLINNVTTYTRNTALIRVPIHFGISYGSDPKFARELVLKTVAKHGKVKSNPPPEVQFLGFGDSSLDFRLLVWMDNPIRTPRFRSDIYFMIWDAFARHNIEIPFPQRDLHLRSGWEQLVGEARESG